MEQQKCEYADLKVSPSELRFEVNEGWQFIPPHQSIFIERVGIGMSARWKAITSKPWVRTTGEVGSGKDTVRVSCSSVGMPAGIYSDLVEITSSADITITGAIVLITLTVHPVESPAPPVPPSEPEPEPEPEPGPEPEPEPEPDPDPEPDPEPEPPDTDWVQRFLSFLEKLFDWLFEQFGSIWKK